VLPVSPGLYEGAGRRCRVSERLSSIAEIGTQLTAWLYDEPLIPRAQIAIGSQRARAVARGGNCRKDHAHAHARCACRDGALLVSHSPGRTDREQGRSPTRRVTVDLSRRGRARYVVRGYSDGRDSETVNGSVHRMVPPDYNAQLKTGTVNERLRALPVHGNIEGRMSRPFAPR
jgi:hypothetical protein